METAQEDRKNPLYKIYERPIYGKDFILFGNYIVHIKRIAAERNDFNIKSCVFNETRNVIELLDYKGKHVYLSPEVSSRFFINVNETDNKLINNFQNGFSKESWNYVIKKIKKQLQENVQAKGNFDKHVNPNSFLYDIKNSQNMNSDLNKASENISSCERDTTKKEIRDEKKEPTENAVSKKKKPKSVLVFLLEMIVIVVLFKIYGIFLRITLEENTAMSPTISSSAVISSRIPITFKGINRGDVVLAYIDFDKVICRVIGLPNEVIEQRNDGIYIDGVLYEESYIDESHNVNSKDWTWSFALGEDEYFLMFDNRDNATYDCRMNGPINSKCIRQKVLFE